MSDTVTVITNHVPRFTVDACNVPASARDEFDYLDWDALEAGLDSREFVRYRGTWYDLGDLEGSLTLEGSQWDAHLSDTFFSGILVRWCEGFESVILGRYFS